MLPHIFVNPPGHAGASMGNDTAPLCRMQSSHFLILSKWCTYVMVTKPHQHGDWQPGYWKHQLMRYLAKKALSFVMVDMETVCLRITECIQTKWLFDLNSTLSAFTFWNQYPWNHWYIAQQRTCYKSLAMIRSIKIITSSYINKFQLPKRTINSTKINFELFKKRTDRKRKERFQSFMTLHQLLPKLDPKTRRFLVIRYLILRLPSVDHTYNNACCSTNTHTVI